MKATELKIGDWINTSSLENPVYRKVKGLADNYILVDSKCRYATGSRALSPIPLTPEILEKNGWRKDLDAPLWTLGRLGLYWYTINEYYELCFIRGYIQSIACTEVRYVHQLQHLLWALGIDDDLMI